MRAGGKESGGDEEVVGRMGLCGCLRSDEDNGDGVVRVVKLLA